MADSQTANARGQRVPTSKKVWSWTFVPNDSSDQADCVFVAGDSLSQGNKMDIDFAKHIINVTNGRPPGLSFWKSTLTQKQLDGNTIAAKELQS